MKIVSGYMPVKGMPTKELQKHINSYNFFGNENFFFSNIQTDFENCQNIKIDIDENTHQFVFKHICLKRYFEMFPEETTVLYVDTDTFCNKELVFPKLENMISLVKYTPTRKKRIYNSGVFEINRDFLDMYLGELMNSDKTHDDELFLSIYIKNNKIPVDELPPDYNYSRHKMRRKVNCETGSPYILHFHLERERHLPGARRYSSPELRQILGI